MTEVLRICISGLVAVTKNYGYELQIATVNFSKRIYLQCVFPVQFLYKFALLLVKKYVLDCKLVIFTLFSGLFSVFDGVMCFKSSRECIFNITNLRDFLFL